MNITYQYLLHIIDWSIFIYMSISVLYLSFFTYLSYRKKKEDNYEQSDKLYRFAVFIPAYKEDAVIENTVSDFLKQTYPTEYYDVIVIDDQLKSKTLLKLKKHPIIITNVLFENSTKAKALRFAFNNLKKSYDIVIILDADNLVDITFLKQISNAFRSGLTAVQTHRVAKSLDTNIAILDAVSEEINNTIFRKGHVKAGLSSALIGSGMAFDFELFKNSIMELDENHVGEDKQLEIWLLRKRIFVAYLEYVYTYDEKVSQSKVFFTQRRRWLSTQFSNLNIGLKDLSNAFKSKNWDYCDKLIQWTMPSRITLLGIITILAVVISYINLYTGLKWIVMDIILIWTLLFAIPSYLINYRLVKAIFMIPYLFLLMIINYFRLSGAGKKFIHTNHGE